MTTHRTRLRLLRTNVKEHRCECCKMTHWNGRLIPLELDHINGDKTDNNLDNLRILCCNCHAQTDTWRGRKLKKPLKSDLCQKCFRKKVSRTGLCCKSCAAKHKTKIQWPDKETLIKMVKESNYSKVAKLLRVSDNAVRKRIKDH